MKRDTFNFQTNYSKTEYHKHVQNDGMELYHKFCVWYIFEVFKIKTMNDLEYAKKTVKTGKSVLKTYYQQFAVLYEGGKCNITYYQFEKLFVDITYQNKPFIIAKKSGPDRYYLLNFDVLLNYYQNQHKEFLRGCLSKGFSIKLTIKPEHFSVL